MLASDLTEITGHPSLSAQGKRTIVKVLMTGTSPVKRGVRLSKGKTSVNCIYLYLY
jgi:hypothetical protein